MNIWERQHCIQCGRENINRPEMTERPLPDGHGTRHTLVFQCREHEWTVSWSTPAQERAKLGGVA